MSSPDNWSLRVTLRVSACPLASAAACLLITCAMQTCALQAQDSTWALTNVNVVDLEHGRVLTRRAIRIRGDRIVTVVDGPTPGVSGEARQVDGRGAFVIPGLYDMHAHLGITGVVTEASLTDRVRQGVLGVRDMGFPIDSLSALATLVRRPRDDSFVAPRVWYVGPTLNAPSTTTFPQHVQVADSSAIESIVGRIAAGGGTAVKVHDRLSQDAYRQVAAAARARGLPMVGHIPALVPIDDVIKEHQRSVEHLGGLTHAILMACSHDTTARQRAGAAIVPEDFFRLYRVTMSAAHLTPLLDGFDANRCAVLARRLRAAGSWQVPNLVLWKTWATTVPDASESPSEDDLAARRRLYRTMLDVTRILYREHVLLMAGTDEMGSIHDELAALVDAGLPPADALRAATVQPARFLGASASFGAVRPGYIADFVLLDGNPLVDIHNTRRVVGLVQGGRYRNVAASPPKLQ